MGKEMTRHYLTADTVNGVMEWNDLDSFGENAPEIVEAEDFAESLARLAEDEFIGAVIEDGPIYERIADEYGITDKREAE